MAVTATKEALMGNSNPPAKNNTAHASGAIRATPEQLKADGGSGMTRFGGGIDQDFDPKDYIGYHSIVPGANMNEIRAYSQSNWDKIGNAVAQSAAELMLTIGEGVGYLIDVPQHWNMLKGTEDSFSNWFSDLMIQGKEHIRDVSNPIYSPEASMGFKPGSVSWWARNLPSITSSISLLIPSYGAVRGLSMLAKASRASKLVRSVNMAQNLKGISAAIFSRYMENTMESAETMRSLMEELAPKVGEEKARQLAAKEARRQWMENAALLAFDVFQYSAIFKAGKYATAAGKAAEVSRKGVAALAGSGLVLNMGQEGLEEGFQFISGQEAAYRARRNA